MNPGPLRNGARAGGRLRSELDHFDGISVRLRTGGRRIDSTATLGIYEEGRPVPLRQSRRRTVEYADDSWQMFPFDSIPESTGREYAFSLETDAGGDAIEVTGLPGGPAVQYIVHHSPELRHLLDPWLARNGRRLPAIPERLERYLDRHVYQCVKLRQYFFLRLAHLADAVGRIPEPISDVLAVGAGAGFQEAFLAARFPDLRVLATDFNKYFLDYPMPNLSFERLDLLDPPDARQYDLVFSIECLEHIEDHRRAFRHKAARVRPGKYLYISVPFASREEQADPQWRRKVWEEHEHYTPGFNFEDLEELFAENGLEVLHASNMFHLDVELPVRRILEVIGAPELEAGARAVARLLLQDLDRDQRVASCRQAEGIRFLGRKKGR
jgi:SAM-dependent methyltransferase